MAPSPTVGQKIEASLFQSGVRSMETTHRTISMLRAKVVIVGDACVGKTALVQMLKSGGHDYPKNYIMTIGVEFGVKQMKIPDTDCVVELLIFDCSGQGVFNKLEQSAAYYENTAFVCVVFDVSSRDSFESCGRWLQGVRAAMPSTAEPLPGVLIANKIDLRQGGINSRAVVDTEESFRFAQQNGLEFFETSAAAAKDVDAPFQHMASTFHRAYDMALTFTRIDELASFTKNDPQANESTGATRHEEAAKRAGSDHRLSLK